MNAVVVRIRAGYSGRHQIPVTVSVEFGGLARDS